eukprot:jgi/Tetstr1/424835/TSEL_015338.t1
MDRQADERGDGGNDGGADQRSDAFLDDADPDELEEMEDCLLHTIRQGLFLGSMQAEANLEAMRAKGVTHVLQVGEGLTPSHPELFTYKGIYVDDDEREDLVAHFPKCFSFIEEACSSEGGELFGAGRVLVHCAAGCSRSATVCLGYLMWKDNLTFDEAWRVVHAARPWICPNDGFKKQLREFERLGCDLAKWRAWRHVEPQQHEQNRRAAATKMVLDRSKVLDGC